MQLSRRSFLTTLASAFVGAALACRLEPAKALTLTDGFSSRFILTGITTGRWSSSIPNFTSIPKVPYTGLKQLFTTIDNEIDTINLDDYTDLC